MKNYKEQKCLSVGAWVSVDIKKRLYEIAELENTTVSEIVRRFIEKGVSEYKEVKKNG